MSKPQKLSRRRRDFTDPRFWVRRRGGRRIPGKDEVDAAKIRAAAPAIRHEAARTGLLGEGIPWLVYAGDNLCAAVMDGCPRTVAAILALQLPLDDRIRRIVENHSYMQPAGSRLRRRLMAHYQTQSGRSWTALCAATQLRSKVFLEWLLRHRSWEGDQLNEALLQAVVRYKLQMVESLIQAGADPHADTQSAGSALDALREIPSWTRGRCERMRAVLLRKATNGG